MPMAIYASANLIYSERRGHGALGKEGGLVEFVPLYAMAVPPSAALRIYGLNATRTFTV